MTQRTLSELKQGLESGQYSSEEITQDYLQRIKAGDSALNSVITLTEEQALAGAREADERRAAGDVFPVSSGSKSMPS